MPKLTKIFNRNETKAQKSARLKKRAKEAADAIPDGEISDAADDILTRRETIDKALKDAGA